MAFGEKMLKLLTEEVIKKPNVIRMLRPELIFFQACDRAETNLIGSESGRYFRILPTNPGWIVSSFIHKFACCLRMSKNRHFQTIFLLKLVPLLALAWEK